MYIYIYVYTETLAKMYSSVRWTLRVQDPGSPKLWAGELLLKGQAVKALGRLLMEGPCLELPMLCPFEAVYQISQAKDIASQERTFTGRSWHITETLFTFGLLWVFELEQ